MKFIVASALEKASFNVDVYHCVLDAFMSEELLNVERVFCFMIKHCAFPMSQCVKGDPFDSWVVRFLR